MPDVLGPTRRMGMRLLRLSCRKGIPMPDVLGPTRRIGMRGIRMP
jgi:hypothetical protein